MPDQTPDEIWPLLERTLLERCPPGVRLRVKRGHDGRPYVVVPPDRPNTPREQSPRLAAAFRALEIAALDIMGKRPRYLREGGTISIIADLKSVLGLDSVMMGMFLPEDNLHAPNESFHLGVMEKGIQISQRIMRDVAATG